VESLTEPHCNYSHSHHWDSTSLCACIMLYIAHISWPDTKSDYEMSFIQTQLLNCGAAVCDNLSTFRNRIVIHVCYMGTVWCQTWNVHCFCNWVYLRCHGYHTVDNFKICILFFLYG